jgi:heterotetrameric sarcosine oxidase delta subunit
MALMIPCPNCGVRPYTEFWCSGELPESGHGGGGGAADVEKDFERVWLRRNVAGDQVERWFHHGGCRRWLTLTRNTITNAIHDVV